MYVIILLGIISITLLFTFDSHAQQCDSLVPTFFVDISASVDSGFISVDTSRYGNCCGTSHPDKCIKFNLLLHPDAAGILFNIYSGAIPSGSMFYQINCGPQAAVGQSICLNGPGPHEITFCKPGNNINEYIIQSIPGHSVSENIGINFGCSGSIYSIGYDPDSIKWTSIYPGTIGTYNNYLACDTCAITSVTPVGAAPPYIDFQVSGVPQVTCATTYASDTVRVYFYPEIDVVFNPITPILCSGVAFASVTAQASGGTPPTVIYGVMELPLLLFCCLLVRIMLQ